MIWCKRDAVTPTSHGWLLHSTLPQGPLNSISWTGFGGGGPHLACNHQPFLIIHRNISFSVITSSVRVLKLRINKERKKKNMERMQRVRGGLGNERVFSFWLTYVDLLSIVQRSRKLSSLSEIHCSLLVLAFLLLIKTFPVLMSMSIPNFQFPRPWFWILILIFPFFQTDFFEL